MDELLKVENLFVDLEGKDKIFNIFKGVSFSLSDNASLAIIGESGSGKTMLCRAICGILPPNLKRIEGKILYKGEDIINNPSSEIGLVLQNPQQCISPLIKIGKFFDDVLLAHGIKDDYNSLKIESLARVGIKNPEKRINQYPYEMSGGMLQRIMIAIVLSIKPKICIFDEPTTGLDVVTQKEIIELILKIKKEENMAIIVISHDINLACCICEDIIIMRNGLIIDRGNNLEQIEKNTQNEYVKDLISSSKL